MVIGQIFVYKPDGSLCELTDLKGNIAKIRQKGARGSYYASTDKMNLELATPEQADQFFARRRR